MFNNRRSVRRTAMITAVTAMLLFSTSGCVISDYIYDLLHPCEDNWGCEILPSGG